MATRGCPRMHSASHSHRGPVVRVARSRLQARCRGVAPHAQQGGTPALAQAPPSLTRRVFEGVDVRTRASTGQAGGAGGGTTWDAFVRADAAWSALRTMREGMAAGPPPRFVEQHVTPLASPPVSPAAGALGGAGRCAAPRRFDVVVAGGTLGVFVAAALAARGLAVAVLERGPLRGRDQEWNISRAELGELVELGLLTEQEVEEVASIEFNPVRVGFAGGADVWTRDVLNLGVAPDRLVQLMRRKLEAADGCVYEHVALQGVDVHPDGVACRLLGAPARGAADGSAAQPPAADETRITARLLVDCMGHASPIVRQIRWGQRPDGVCLVVGTLASGFDPVANTTADVIYTFDDLQPASDSETARLQYFWESFPAGAGPTHRTTYMFAYMDAQPWRPSLAALFEDYWRLMPQYQALKGEGEAALAGLTFERVLFGCFPTFRDSPLRPAFDRVLQVGDASGIQSPLSFGGFGALSRHLGRLTRALSAALAADALSAGDLAVVHAYNPGLSAAWMLQRAMTSVHAPRGRSSADGGGAAPPGLINAMLAANFGAMQRLGPAVMRPFLQDVIQFVPLLRTMAQQVVDDPLSVPRLMAHVGAGPLLDWLGHVGALGAYTVLHHAAGPPLRAFAAAAPLAPRQRFRLERTLDAWEYGSGADFKLPPEYAQDKGGGSAAATKAPATARARSR